MYAIASVAAVGLRRFLRDRSNVFFVFVLPFLIIFLVGSAAGGAQDRTLAVVGADTDLGTSVLGMLESVEIERFDDVDAASLAVGESQAGAMVVFPQSEGEPLHVRSRTAGSGIELRAALDAAVAADNQRRVIERQAGSVGRSEVEIRTAVETTPETEVRTVILGTEVWQGLDDIEASALTQVVLFTFLSALTASGLLVQDRTSGMARRKAAAPVSVSQLVAGETLGRFWIALFQAGLVIAVTGLLFGVDWGHPIGTGGLIVAFAAVSTGAGVLLSSLVDNPEGANGAGVMLGLVMAALGGAMAPVEIFPDAMQTVARLTPHYWAIDGLKTSLAGGSLDEVFGPLLVLTTFAAVILAASSAIYRRRAFG